MASISIRRAQVEDFPLVTMLWKEMMTYHLTLDPRFAMAPDHQQAYLEYLHSIKDNYDYIILVAESGQEIVGYTVGMILSNPAVFALARYGFIAEMAVTQSHQHEGVGKQLWDYIRRWFHRRGVQVIQLNVSPLNEKGYEFWTKMGCREFLHILWHDIPRKL
jgi:GNAT superfamily N-acetyltransferase